jgi:DNA replication protein DnaC
MKKISETSIGELIDNASSNLKAHGIDIATRQTITYSFGTIPECKQLLMQTLSHIDKTAKIEWLPEYDEVANWMSNTQGKGLLLTGPCGRGKSNIIFHALPVLFMIQNKVIHPVHVQHLPQKLNETLKKWCYCIDDVGTEEEYNDYGTKFFPFTKIMNEAENKLKLILLSTNLTGKQIRDKYDDRVLDRIIRLCKIVQFEGKSLRK